MTIALAMGPRCTAAEGAICDNAALMRSVRVIDSACHDLSGCDFDALNELNGLNREELLNAWADQEVSAVHIFFPTNVFDVTRAYDWDQVRDQLESLQYLTNTKAATLYVIGQASRKGTFDRNVALSRRRMQSVSLYIRDVLKIECHAVRGGYLGAKFIQLSKGDATRLRLHPDTFRRDELVLNQAVHVFVIPCRLR